MRIAATADLHFAPPSATVLRNQLDKVRDDADLLIVAGDLTNYGRPAEMEPLLNTMVRLRVPIIVVLGNHDYEFGARARGTGRIQDSGAVDSPGIEVLPAPRIAI